MTRGRLPWHQRSVLLALLLGPFDPDSPLDPPWLGRVMRAIWVGVWLCLAVSIAMAVAQAA